MPIKYIKQIINQDFVFPNAEISEYDIELVQDINNNSVSGTVTSFSATTISSSELTCSYNYSWAKNGAEPFISNAGNINIVSVHMLAPGQDYYKPWRTIDFVSNATTGLTSYSGTDTFTVTPSQVGLDSFTNGTYYFEFRFIGHRAIYPILTSLSLTTATPTPTPTPTVTPTVGPTPTPTATPTPTPTSTPTPTGGGISLEVYGRDINGTPATLTFFYSINGGGNVNVPGYTGNPLPGTCTLLYTITGLTEFDAVEFGTSIACVMTGASATSSCPSSIGSLTTYVHNVDSPSIQQVALTIDSGTIP